MHRARHDVEQPPPQPQHQQQEEAPRTPPRTPSQPASQCSSMPSAPLVSPITPDGSGSTQPTELEKRAGGPHLIAAAAVGARLALLPPLPVSSPDVIEEYISNAARAGAFSCRGGRARASRHGRVAKECGVVKLGSGELGDHVTYRGHQRTPMPYNRPIMFVTKGLALHLQRAGAFATSRRRHRNSNGEGETARACQPAYQGGADVSHRRPWYVDVPDNLIPRRTVEEFYLNTVLETGLRSYQKWTYDTNTSWTPKKILIFLPGTGEVFATASKLGDDTKEWCNVKVLYSGMSHEEDEALNATVPGKWDVYVCTDVAESSITIDVCGDGG
ncbi:unnamed protein product [Vitrella brassicaformis CCMP3155]|uniref:Uncharacterized protein n=1 Tax=Vitrella brassicaformis (strain CCMP3155) TaxID=1169540 RepID=A0A0G4ED00_VITBC|nr:unnamed protein product [Vitrella brassicaformis CCMP3155]|eukprot:CEL93213.1 unnamed protein product [Vitrella brassicaformis CCMP3155]